MVALHSVMGNGVPRVTVIGTKRANADSDSESSEG